VADTLAETYLDIGRFSRLDVVGELPLMYCWSSGALSPSG
jgi:L-asparaginase